MSKEITPDKKSIEIGGMECFYFDVKSKESSSPHVELSVGANWISVSINIDSLTICLDAATARKLAFVLHGQAKKHEEMEKEFAAYSEECAARGWQE